MVFTPTSVTRANSARYLDSDGSVRSAIRWVVCLAVSAFIFSAPNVAEAIVVTDDFSDLNDTANPAWTHLDKLVGSTGQTWNASTGQYRLTAPANGVVPLAPQFNGLGFAGSYVPQSFSDVKVSADFVDFQTDIIGPAFFYGVMARADGANTEPTPGQGFTLRAYGYAYEPENQEVVLYLFTGSGNRDIGSRPVVLDSANDYRFELEVIGGTLQGRVIQLDGGAGTVVAEQSRDLIANPITVDDDGDPATPQVMHEPYASGFSGILGVGNVFDPDLDYTIDNFRSESIGGLTGDYNENGVVDAADYVVWRENLGTTNTLPNDDIGGTIGANHYNQWRANFGSGSAGLGSAQVPEPTSIAIVLVAIVASSGGRFRRVG